MKTVLDDVNVIPGVSGCFVCNQSGGILVHAMPPIYDQDMLGQAAHMLSWISEGIAHAGRLEDVDLSFQQGRFVVRALEDGFLCMLCVPEVNSSLLGMTANVAVRKLNDHLKRSVAEDQPATPTRVRQLEALVRLELGSHSEKALDMLADAPDDTRELKKVCARIEKLTRLFVDKRKAKELADSMAAILRDEEGTRK